MWPFSSSTASTEKPTISKGPDKCPVDHSTHAAWLAHSAPPHPLKTVQPTASSAPSDACPVDHETRSVWLANATASSSSSPSSPPPPADNHPFHSHPSRTPVSSTRETPPLPTSRVISSIPRASPPDSSLPIDHISSSDPSSSTFTRIPPAGPDEKWVYPSEQQFFQAMLRKNHNPRAEDMKTIVPIHNAVNEKAWEEVLKWENGMGGESCGGVKLVSFVGKPKVRSPKALFKMALGYNAPFDRHDWIVSRCGTPVRYVIDFYTGRTDSQNRTSLAFHIDARPALDSWEGIRTRFMGFIGK